MPAFHTKTIESILDPVAQQVSQLIVAHEDCADGSTMPDLRQPVAVVRGAVDNLVKVGHDTIAKSDDSTLKVEMPPCLVRVEEAARLLHESATVLISDTRSAIGRRKLIEGSRGILQGTTALLVAFDDSEVRRIVRVCKSVLDFMSVVEVIDSMDDLVSFIKNVSPVLTRMTKEVSAREKELLSQSAREKLSDGLEQIKQLTPVLISAVKLHIAAKVHPTTTQRTAIENRDFVARQVCNEIEELIRVLHLTTGNRIANEAEYANLRPAAASGSTRFDETTRQQAESRLIATLLSLVDAAIAEVERDSPAAQNWLNDSQAPLGSSNEAALKRIVDLCTADCRSMNDRFAEYVVMLQRLPSSSVSLPMSLGQFDADRREFAKLLDEIAALLSSLSELRATGQRENPSAHSLARSLTAKLIELAESVRTMRARLRSSSGVGSEDTKRRRDEAVSTLSGRGGLTNQIEALNGWLRSSAMLHDAAAIRRARALLDALLIESRALIGKFLPADRAVASNACDAVERLGHDLHELAARPGVDPTELRRIGQQLSQHLAELDGAMRFGLAALVSEATADVNGPLKQLITVTRDPATNQGPEQERERLVAFERSADEFLDRNRSLSTTATILAQHGTNRGGEDSEETQDNEAERTAAKRGSERDTIRKAARRVEELGPHVVSAARLRLAIGDSVTEEHLELLRERWTSQADRLRILIDEQLDSLTFVRVLEQAIAKRIFEGNRALSERDAAALAVAVADAARRANRVVQIVQSEAENTDDAALRERLSKHVRLLAPLIPAVVIDAKNLAGQPTDVQLIGVWRDGSRELLNQVSAVRFTLESVAPPARVAYVPPPVPINVAFGQAPTPAEPVVVNVAPAAAQHVDIPVSASPLVPQPPPRATDSLPRYTPSSSVVSFSGDAAPPRPPKPAHYEPTRYTYNADDEYVTDTETEDDFPIISPHATLSREPLLLAAHALHMDVRQWSSRGNDIIAAAKRLALLMAKLSQIIKGEWGTKKDLIDVARAINEAAEDITRLAKELSLSCSDRRMRSAILHACERIPTIATQLKIVATVKATLLGSQDEMQQIAPLDDRSEEDQEATEILIGNAKNLMEGVRDTVKAAESASIKMRIDAGVSLKWVRKRPWFV